MPELHLSTSINVFLLFAAGASALGFSLFVYRFTVPPVPRTLKMILIALRTLGVFFVILLIGEPLLSLLSRTTEPPTVAVLVDNSKSMTIRDNAGDRQTALRSLLQSSSLQQLSSEGEVQYGIFDTKARLLSSFSMDSLTLNGDGTDIGAALKRAKETAARVNLQSILLLTDGNSTSGTSPLFEAEELGIPVFTVGIGDTSEQKDVLVRKVVTNTIAYAGTRVPVNVTVKSSGYGSERVEVLLRDANKVLDRRTLTLEGGVREYGVTLSFVPEQEGMQKFTVELSQLPGEVTHQNNRWSFFTKVLKSKINVLLVAGAASPDVSFIRRSLESDQNISVKTFIERKNGQFYEGTLSANVLQEVDCLVLVGFPVASSSISTLTLIAEAAHAGKGMFLVVSRTIDPAKLRALDQILPFSITVQPVDEQQVFFVLSEAQRNNPIVKLSSSADAGGIWSQLPPLFVSGIGYRAKPEAEVLGRMRIQSISTNDPLLVTRNINRRKSIALLAYGLWRWKLMSAGTTGAENLLDEFLSNGIRWLTTREDERSIRVQPIRESFSAQDPVEFTGQIYDENFRPIDNAEVVVTITRGEQSSQITLTPLGNGQYEGALESLGEGDYTFTGKVNVGGKQIGEDRGSFSVGGLNAEFQETRMNKLLLQQLAARTGGRYYDATDIGNVPKDISALPNFHSREVVHSSEVELWNRSWMLAVVIVLFAVEWFLRKRSGML